MYYLYEPCGLHEPRSSIRPVISYVDEIRVNCLGILIYYSVITYFISIIINNNEIIFNVEILNNNNCL